MEQRKKRVLISGIAGNSYGAQVAKSLSLHPKSYLLFGMDCAPNLLQDGMNFEYIFKVPPAADPAYLDAIKDIYKKQNIDCLIEGSEQEQKFLNAHRAALQSRAIDWLSNNQAVIDLCTSKKQLADFLVAHSFNGLKTYIVPSLDALDAVEEYPVILKPDGGSSGSRDVYIAQSEADIYAICQLSDRRIDQFCIQQYVGTPDGEYTVGVLHGANGKNIGTIVLKRDLTGLSLRSSITNKTGRQELGDQLVISSGISQGTIIRSEPIETFCRGVADALQSTGPLNIQGRLHQGKFYIFEINPRFSGTSYMRALAGFNEAHTLLSSADVRVQDNAVFRRYLKEAMS